MISFRTRNDIAASIATIAAILILTISLIVMVFAPKPKPLMNKVGYDNAVEKVRIEEKDATQATQAANADVATWLWAGSAAEVSPQALARATELSQKYKLKLVAFRPQRVISADGLTQLPFQISVEGSFPQVASMLKDLETPNGRLCVNLVQVSASEGGTDAVSATIGGIAFLSTPAPATSKTSSTTTTTATTVPAPDAQP